MLCYINHTAVFTACPHLPPLTQHLTSEPQHTHMLLGHFGVLNIFVFILQGDAWLVLQNL